MILKSRWSEIRKRLEKYIVLVVRSNLQISGQVSLVELMVLEPVAQVPSTEHQKGKNNPHDVVTQALSVFFRFLQGATATSKGGPIYVDLRTSHSWDGFLKRTLRSLDFHPGSASFLPRDSTRALISSPAVGLEWMGDSQSQSQQRWTFVANTVLSSFQLLDGHGQNL